MEIKDLELTDDEIVACCPKMDDVPSGVDPSDIYHQRIAKTQLAKALWGLCGWIRFTAMTMPTEHLHLEAYSRIALDLADMLKGAGLPEPDWTEWNKQMEQSSDEV